MTISGSVEGPWPPNDFHLSPHAPPLHITRQRCRASDRAIVGGGLCGGPSALPAPLDPRAAAGRPLWTSWTYQAAKRTRRTWLCGIPLLVRLPGTLQVRVCAGGAAG